MDDYSGEQSKEGSKTSLLIEDRQDEKMDIAAEPEQVKLLLLLLCFIFKNHDFLFPLLKLPLNIFWFCNIWPVLCFWSKTHKARE